MAKFVPNFVADSKLGDVPISEGNFIANVTKQQLAVDYNGQRLTFSDFITVATKEELDAIESPLPKLYFVEATSKLYVWGPSGWVTVGADGSLEITVQASDLQNGIYNRTWSALGLSTKMAYEIQDSEGWDITSDSRLRRKTTAAGIEIDFSDLQDSAPFTLLFSSAATNQPQMIPWVNPPAEMIKQTEFGISYELNDTTPEINYAYNMSTAAFAFWLVSADSEVSGNVVFEILADDVSKGEFVLPAGASPSWKFIWCDASGKIKIVRKISSANDTLKSEGSTVGVIVACNVAFISLV